eukprot:GILI01006971.1.p1 GENE.GILI01006971.1~~GILI01006971.1.p1  ORF type:complete len:777 (-),score=200.59 GILI01006971.1:150-2480(-)
MRFTISSTGSRNTEAVTSVSASLHGEILSGSDDYSVWRWNSNGEPIAKVGDFESCVTFVAWIPTSSSGGKRRDNSAREHFIVGFADGSLRFMNAATGRVDKVVEAAHVGAVTSVAFASDASTIATAGEDGVVKIWSQAGIQRSVLANIGKSIYVLLWGTESADMNGETILYSSGSDLVIKAINPSAKRQIKWKAHNGAVLCADWSRMSNYIVTGGEDGAFKVWDSYGLNVFSYEEGQHPITSIGFAPDGELFAVGSYLNLRICDKTGWTHCTDRVDGGSVMSLSWTSDGTQVVCGGGTGAVSVAQLIDRHMHWGNLNVTMTDSKKLVVEDVLTGAVEDLNHSDKVIKISIGYGFLIVCTTTQCVAYDVMRLKTPSSFDLRDAVITLAQTVKHFLIADCDQGLSVFTNDGRSVCNIKIAANIRPEMIGHQLVSIAPETVAVRDPANAKKILFFDSLSGKPIKGAEIVHELDILELKLSQNGTQSDRLIVFVDRNRDLNLSNLKGPTHKISTMTSSIKWHDTLSCLSAVSDGHLVTWYLPVVMYLDRDLLPDVKYTRDDGSQEFTRNDKIQDFSTTRINVRRGSDGALLSFGISPYPALLFSHTANNDWELATRLCRFLDDRTLWSILAALAIKSSDLNTAGVAYGALNELDKVRYIDSVKKTAPPEGRQAAVAVFTRRADEAERILLQAGLVYRAIDMHIKLHDWERALALANERSSHIDTVLCKRAAFLEEMKMKETSEKFRHAASKITFDKAMVEEKIKHELEEEARRPNAKPYQ